MRVCRNACECQAASEVNHSWWCCKSNSRWRRCWRRVMETWHPGKGLRQAHCRHPDLYAKEKSMGLGHMASVEPVSRRSQGEMNWKANEIDLKCNCPCERELTMQCRTQKNTLTNICTSTGLLSQTKESKSIQHPRAQRYFLLASDAGYYG